MFGIILGMFSAGCAAIGRTKQKLDNAIFRNEAASQGKRVYYDHFGGARDVKTNKDLIFGFQRGDKCYFDVNGNVVYNLTQEERGKELLKKLNNLEEGKTAVLYRHEFYRKKENGFDRKYMYDVYIDVATKKMMYEKKVSIWMHPDFKKWTKRYKQENPKATPLQKDCRLYFDLMTDEAIRLSDWDKRLREFGIEEEIVEMVNSEEYRSDALYWMLL